MKSNILKLFILLLMIPLLHAQSGQKDQPLKGEHTFKIEKVWQVEEAGDDVFARIREIKVADNGHIYILDRKNRRFYIMGGDGKLVKAFGKKGEGPGEFRIIEQCNMFLTDDRLMIHDELMVHILDLKGNHIRTKVVPSRQQPVLFLSPGEYISAHLTRLQAPDGKGTIRKVNLNTGSETVIAKFSMFQGGAINNQNIRAAFSSVALTPMMRIHLIDGKLFYGMNDVYRITVSDLKGKVEREFGIERPKRPITTKEIEDRLIAEAKDLAPVELLKRLAKTVPNEMTHFSDVEKHNGLFYVFTSYYGRDNRQRIDIFSPDGKYLYRAFITVDEEYEMVTMPLIKGGHVYMVLEDEEGNQSLAKYKIQLPL